MLLLGFAVCDGDLGFYDVSVYFQIFMHGSDPVKPFFPLDETVAPVSEADLSPIIKADVIIHGYRVNFF